MTPPDRNAERTAQRGREIEAIIARMEGELSALHAQIAAGASPADQARIETEIVHLTLALAPLYSGHYSR